MEGKPEHVRNAQRANDTEALRAMGAKGGVHAGLLNADRRNKEMEDMEKFMAAQGQIYQMNEEGDILPPDPSVTPPTKH